MGLMSSFMPMGTREVKKEFTFQTISKDGWVVDLQSTNFNDVYDNTTYPGVWMWRNSSVGYPYIHAMYSTDNYNDCYEKCVDCGGFLTTRTVSQSWLMCLTIGYFSSNDPIIGENYSIPRSSTGIQFINQPSVPVVTSTYPIIYLFVDGINRGIVFSCPTNEWGIDQNVYVRWKLKDNTFYAKAWLMRNPEPDWTLIISNFNYTIKQSKTIITVSGHQPANSYIYKHAFTEIIQFYNYY